MSQTGFSAGHTDAEFPVFGSAFLISTLNPRKIVIPSLTLNCYPWLGFNPGSTSRSQLSWHFAAGLPTDDGTCVATEPGHKEGVRQQLVLTQGQATPNLRL